MNLELPDPVFTVVVTSMSKRFGYDEYDGYRAEILIGEDAVFEREYSNDYDDWCNKGYPEDWLAESEEQAREMCLKVFAEKLRQVLR